MKKSRLLGAVCAISLVSLANTAQASLITTINALDIGGTLYDVTFHNTQPISFNALWDADNDGVFGGGTSLFSEAPTFWGDLAGAQQAVYAIMTALGTADTTNSNFGDKFYIPWGTTITNGGDVIIATTDTSGLTNTDGYDVANIFETTEPFAAPWATFASSTAVPVPAAAWLFGSGLLGLIGVARKKAT